MTTNQVLDLLARFEKRLATLADQARETCEQAKHTLDRLILLQDDLARFREHMVATSDTAVYRVPRVQ